MVPGGGERALLSFTVRKREDLQVREPDLPMVSLQLEGLLAEVYTFIGEYEKALDFFEDLLSKPSTFSWEDIKYHWVYHKAFKDNPRFKSIVKKDEDRFRKEATYDLGIYLP